MKISKKIELIFLVILIILMSLVSCSFGATTKKLGLYVSSGNVSRNGRPTGFYTTGTTNHKKTNIPVIKIVEFASNGASMDTSKSNQAIYCLKDGVGFGSDTPTSTTVDYTVSCDMRNPSGNSLLSEYKNNLGDDKYKKLMWLLDNICIPEDDSSVNTLLNNAGEYSKSEVFSNLDNDKIKDILEVIQQAAIWYITNAGDDYQPTRGATLNVAETNGGESQSIEDVFSLDMETISDIYSYLIETPESNSGYDYTKNTSTPLSFESSSAAITYQNDGILIGPYKVTQSGNNYTDFNAKISNGSGEIISPTIIKDSTNGSEVSGNNTTEKIKKTIGNQFYIKLPRGTTGSIKIEVSATAQIRKLTYWSTAANTASKNQPVVFIEKGTEAFSANNTQQVNEQTTNIKVTKNWVDSNNENGNRVEITVQLLENGQVTDKEQKLNQSNNWTYTFQNLPMYKNGAKVSYSVKEKSVPAGYTSSGVSGNETNGFTITNTEQHTSISVNKKWVDSDDQDGLRPESITVQLLANGSVNKEQQLNESNQWQYTFSNLPVYKNGKKVTYTVQEKEATIPDGYTASVASNATDGFNFTITNTHNANVTQVSVNKVWVDHNNKEGIRPTSVTVELLKNGTKIQDYVLNEGNKWSHTFTDLPLKDDGTAITYTVREKQDTVPEGYTATVTGSMKTGFTITNTHKLFDLALRKYITKINDKPLNEQNIVSRNPNINESTLETGTTATYNHKKDPILVKTGDIVTYSISIYNEGEKNGYAKQITDQLPTGLKCITTGNVKSKGKNGAEKNTYSISYDENNNKLVLNIVNTEQNSAKALNAYTENNLDYETIEIQCKVEYKAKFGKKNILTNTAWISEDYDTEKQGPGNDIDSKPSEKPSVNKDNMEDYKGKTTNPEDLSNKDYYYEGEQDDDDFEKIYVKYFDLALRKFITAVNEKQLSTNGVYDRAPVVDTTPLLNGKDTASYKHAKDPVKVQANDTITYTIRVYNEGEVDGYAEEIVDHLPPELEFLPDDEINKKYLWTVDSSDNTGRTIKTTYLSESNNQKENLIKGFSGEGTLDYKDIQIRCKIKSDVKTLKKITNIAEITESDNEYDIPDRDNEEEVKKPNDSNLPDYKGKDSNKNDLTDKEYHYEGQEDDDDFEKVVVERFDLALRKFITGVNDEKITSRVPSVDTSKYGTIVDNKEITDMEYTHPKDPVRVANNDIVIYTIRVYNEGTKSGYAAEIKDDIPEGLEFILDHEINQKYGWVLYDKDGNATTNVKEAVTMRTDYLSKDNEEEEGDNLLKAFVAGEMDTPDYRDVQVAFKVIEPNTSDRIITNHAEISKDTDENGDDVDDIDSTPDEWNDGEDDQDEEHIYVKYFDLALRKWVSQVILIEDGVQKEMDTGHYAEQDPEPVVKVELNKKRIENTIIKFRYQIRITNEGEIEGYATEISDYIPEGLKFNQADNPKWREENGKIVTDQLKDTLLQPGESVTIEVVLTWINGEDNLDVKTNVAEISEDDNPHESDDIDSTPNNKKKGEDDIDDAPVVLTVVTGRTPIYIAIISGITFIIGAGAFMIKKYVI